MAEKVAPKKVKVTMPISEETALELVKQMKRVADALDRQHKFTMMTGGKDKLQEIIDSVKQS